jgi:hypothetical protein
LASYKVSSFSSPAPTVKLVCFSTGAETSSAGVSVAGCEVDVEALGALKPKGEGLGTLDPDAAGAPKLKPPVSVGFPNEKAEDVDAGAPKLKAGFETAAVDDSPAAGVDGAESLPNENPTEAVRGFEAGLKLNPPVDPGVLAPAGGGGADVLPPEPTLNEGDALKMKGAVGVDSVGTTMLPEPPPTDFLTSGLIAKIADGRLDSEPGAGEAGVVEPKLNTGAF